MTKVIFDLIPVLTVYLITVKSAVYTTFSLYDRDRLSIGFAIDLYRWIGYGELPIDTDIWIVYDRMIYILYDKIFRTQGT
jgi:chromosome condensin MukBEF complex kleisin-like MukF subunit